MSREDLIEGLFEDLFDESLVSTVKTGAEYFDNLYGTIEEGPIVDFGRLDYPCIMIIPQDTNYQGNGQYEKLVTLFFYFKRLNKDAEYYKEVTRTISASVWLEFLSNSDFIEHKIQGMSSYPGNMENNQLWIREVQFRVTLLYDYPEESDIRKKL